MSERTITAKAAATALFSFAVIGATSYFGYAALQGDTGLVEKVRVERREALLERRLATLVAERRAMENRTRRLSESSLDLDLLDERARAALGYVRADEIVIR